MRPTVAANKARALPGYICAIVTVAIALVTTRTLGVVYIGVESLFFGAVMLTAWFGGLGPALLASALAGFCSAWFFPDPIGQTRFGIDDVVRMAIFFAMAVFISSLHARARRSQEQARAANRAKDHFLAILSHELRNPLNPILTVASMWQGQTSLNEELRDDLAMIRRNVELEVRLIDDLLDLNRVSAGKLVLRRQSVNVAQIIHQTIDLCAAETQAKGVRLIAEDPRDSIKVDADPTRLAQILWNLLKNAIKFTPAGGEVRVQASVEHDAARISVIDTGAGMEPAALAQIFDPFEQGGENVTKQYGGLGLGLAISKSLVEAHGGTITAASEGRDRGSTFTVTLPLARAAQPSAQVAADSSAVRGDHASVLR